MFKRFLRWLLAAIGLLTEGQPVDEQTTEVKSPETDKIKEIVLEVLSAIKAAAVGKPIIYAAVKMVEVAIELLWPKVFPQAKKALTAKGIKVE